jgi:hypothetical protein
MYCVAASDFVSDQQTTTLTKTDELTSPPELAGTGEVFINVTACRNLWDERAVN